MVEVIYFQKKCPHCKEGMFPVKKMHMSWLECRNDKCSYLSTPEAKSGFDPDELVPYTSNLNRR